MAEFRYGRGVFVGRRQVELLMHRLGIQGLPKRTLPRGAKLGKPSTLDLVRRRFTAEGPGPVVDYRYNRAFDEGGQDLLLRGD